MRITEIKEATVSISSNISNAYIDFGKMNVSVVEITTDVVRNGKPVKGYGFNSNGRYAQGCLLRERFIPRIVQSSPDDLLNDNGDNFDPFRIWNVMMTNEKPGGHGERCVAVGVIDMALWDIVSKIEEKPLYQFLADTYRNGNAETEVFVYAAGGYYQKDKGLRGLEEEMRKYLDSGYSVVKIKIGGATLDEDLRRIETVLTLLKDNNQLAVDANGRFDYKTARAYAEALSPFRLRWFEEMCDPLDYQLQAALAEHYPHPIATGENLFSHQDVKNLILYGGLRPATDILQMDPVLSYGLVEYVKMLEVMKQFGWPVEKCIPHGGHQFALNIAAGLGLGGNESYPDVFAPFGGFADGITIENSIVELPTVPGIGFERKSDLMELFSNLFG